MECYTCCWRHWHILSELFVYLTSNDDTDNLCVGRGWDVYTVSNSELESDFEFYIDGNPIDSLGYLKNSLSREYIPSLRGDTRKNLCSFFNPGLHLEQITECTETEVQMRYQFA